MKCISSLGTRCVARFRALVFGLSVVVGISVGFRPVAAAEANGFETRMVSGTNYVAVDGLKTFYRFDRIVREGGELRLERAGDKGNALVVKFSVGGFDCFMNGMRFVLSDRITNLDGKVYISRTDLVKLIDPVLRPQLIRKAGPVQMVILDPGHGGSDSGARNSLGTEAEYNLKVARKIAAGLQKAGFKVGMTRTKDEFIGLQDRVNRANKVEENAIFISIHFNSGGSGARGIETFTLSPPGVAHYGRLKNANDKNAVEGNHQDSANMALASAVHATLLQVLRDPAKDRSLTFDRGIKRARFTVLAGIRHPAILLEGGFMSHPQEARLIDSEAYQNMIASGVVAAVKRYQLAVSPGVVSKR